MNHNLLVFSLLGCNLSFQLHRSLLSNNPVSRVFRYPFSSFTQTRGGYLHNLGTELSECLTFEYVPLLSGESTFVGFSPSFLSTSPGCNISNLSPPLDIQGTQMHGNTSVVLCLLAAVSFYLQMRRDWYMPGPSKLVRNNLIHPPNIKNNRG